MKKTIALLSIATLGVLSMPAQAHQSPSHSYRSDRLDRIEQRIQKQHYRIREGIGSGDLTRKEARRLRKQQRHIIQLTYQFMHDGYLDRHEFNELRNKLNRTSKRIYHLRHNDRNRYTRHYYY